MSTGSWICFGLFANPLYFIAPQEFPYKMNIVILSVAIG